MLPHSFYGLIFGGLTSGLIFASFWQFLEPLVSLVLLPLLQGETHGSSSQTLAS